MYYTYAHFKLDDNTIFYIGVAKSIKRFTSKLGRNRYWINTINKHGFFHKIMFESDSWSLCLEKEKELIKFYGRADLESGPLVNLTDGGEGCLNMSKEHRIKIGNAHRGKKVPEHIINLHRSRLKGTKLSEETRRKQSESHKKVDKSYLIGRKIPNEIREKMRKSHLGKSKNLGTVLSEETKEKMRQAHKYIITDTIIEEIIKMLKLKQFTIKEVARKFNMSSNRLHRNIKKYYEKDNNCNKKRPKRKIFRPRELPYSTGTKEGV